MPLVKIGKFVSFNTNYGVLIEPGAVQLSPEELHKYVSLGFKHCNDELLADACCGGAGPFKDYGELEFDAYLARSLKMSCI